MAQNYIRYVALGDSLTVGVGSSPFLRGFVCRFKTYAETDLQNHICLDIFAKTGATTGDVLHSLKHPLIRNRINSAQIITITAGGNDLINAYKEFLVTKDSKTFTNALVNCKKNILHIINNITKEKSTSNQQYMIRLVTLYNPLPEISRGDKWVQAFNEHIQSFAKLPHVKVADIYRLFKGKEKELLSVDHVHPNDKGYEQIALALRNIDYSPLN